MISREASLKPNKKPLQSNISKTTISWKRFHVNSKLQPEIKEKGTNTVKPLTISKPPKCFLVYFWLLTRRTITQTIPIHQSIIRLPGRLRNKHAGGVRLYHNFPATTSDKMRASRIQEKLYDANQRLKNPSTSLQHAQMRWKAFERAENQSEPSPSFERSLKKL